jgi:methionyl-tRNA formyltransferase
LARLRAYEPELMIVVAYGRILTHDLLAMPSVGFLNVHASLLPRYRGPAPLNWALINGDAETGVTIQWVNYEVDTGPIFLQERLPISDADNVGTLYTTLSERGAALLVQALELLRQGRGIRQEQPDTGVTLAPMITKEMRRINWGLPAHEVCGWIRGQDPRPGAYGLWGGKVVRLFGGRIMQSEGQAGPPGAAVRLTSYGLEIACGQGSVAVAELQLAGHKRLPAAEFLRGQPLLHQLLQ